MNKPETFSSRWGIVAAGVGMAVGTGNMWRFPRIVAANGGAAFLIPWMLFLLIWSIPLMIAELAMGRGSRRGVIGAFTRLTEGQWSWMGGFVALTTIMILFYYSVVTGWAMKFFLAAATGGLSGVDTRVYWETYTTSVWQPILFHVAAALVGAFIIQRGVVSGLERANRLLIPILFVLLIVAAVRAVTLPGAERGLEFLFNPDLSRLTSYRTWLEALTQSAWSTGAGWGLMLTFGTYLRRRDDVVLNPLTIGFADNSVSLIAAMAIVPTAFALLSTGDAMAAMDAGNTGLLFIWIPQLFDQVPGGAMLLPLFFLAVFCAALSSLIAMIELGVRVLMDTGLSRNQAVAVVTSATIVCGVPSAISLTFFENQDWVWGLALMISGLFIALAAAKYGTTRFRQTLVVAEGNDLPVGVWYEWILKYLIPLQFVAMFSWWMYQAATVYDPEGWWSPVRTYSVGTCVVQWGVALFLLRMFNGRLGATSLRSLDTEEEVVA